MMPAPIPVVDERALAEFREHHLAPEALHARLTSGDGVLLVNAPPGVGKTYAAHASIPFALTQTHDLVVYVAPTRALISELLESGHLAGLEACTVILERRPRNRCADLDKEWQQLEQSGCAALAKAKLCEFCPHNADCTWPDQFDQIDETTRVVICTEAYLGINPQLINRIVEGTGAAHALVIFDEALFLATRITRSISLTDMGRFAQAVADVQGSLDEDDDGLGQIADALTYLIQGREELASWPQVSRFSTMGTTLDIQDAGLERFGAAFKYIAYDLVQLLSHANVARWYADESYYFVPVPDTRGCDVIVFSPYMPSQVIEERLQRRAIHALPTKVFRHTQTKVLNITDSVGAVRTLSDDAHFRRVADLFTALLLRDKLLGRRAILVTKKTFLTKLKQHVEDLTAAIGRPLRCCRFDELKEDEPLKDVDVVLINYGILGVNNLKDFDALYCVGGYYAQQAQLDQTYNQQLPPEDQINLLIRTDGGQRRVVAGSDDQRSRLHAHRAQPVLDMIERRVVLQAIGRIRPFTSPATVIAFQQDDLSSALGDVDTYARLSQLRLRLCIPKRAELVRASLGDKLRPMAISGKSYRDIAKAKDISLGSVSRALAMPSLNDLLRGIAL